MNWIVDKNHKLHDYEVFKWIESVINSCVTFDQGLSTIRLINNYEKKYCNKNYSLSHNNMIIAMAKKLRDKLNKKFPFDFEVFVNENINFKFENAR